MRPPPLENQRRADITVSHTVSHNNPQVVTCQRKPPRVLGFGYAGETEGCFRRAEGEAGEVVTRKGSSLESNFVTGRETPGGNDYSEHLLSGDGEVQREHLQPNVTDENEGSATIFSIMINLFSTITGAGMLGLPYAFANTGVVMGLGWFLLTGFGEAYALHLLAKCVIKKKMYSFRELAEETMNLKWSENLVDAMLALNCFGCCCGYLIIIGHLLPDIFREFVHPPDNSVLLNRNILISVVSWVVTFPLVCLKTLDSLRFTSTLGMLGILYVSIVTILFAYRTDLIGDPCENKLECPGDFYWGFTGDLPNILRVLSVFCFAFVSAQNVPKLTQELKDRSECRMGNAIYGAISMSIVLYFLTAVAGYKAFGDSVDADLLRSFPINKYTSAARIGITTVLCTTFPLQMFPTKNSVCNLIFGKNAVDCSNFQFYITTFFLVAATWVIGVWINDLSIILEFGGATTAICIGYTLPSFFYIKIFSNPKDERLTCDMVMSYIILTASLILSPILIAVEIYSFLDKSSTK